MITRPLLPSMRPYRLLLRHGAVIGFIGFLLVSPTPAMAQRHYSAMGPEVVELHDSLGRHHYHVTTSRGRAQDYFDQGMRFFWALDPRQARRSFEEAERIDRACAMCAWGVALSIAAVPGADTDPQEEGAATRAIRRAAGRGRKANEKEQALIAALAARYARGAAGGARDTTWALRLGALAAAWPDDVEIRLLHVEAMLRLARERGPSAPQRAQLRQVVEEVLATSADHPGACHLLVHLSPRTQRELPSCVTRLTWLGADAPHTSCVRTWGSVATPAPPNDPAAVSPPTRGPRP